MIDLILVALFQAAAGPAEAPASEPAAQASTQPAEQAAAAPQANEGEERLRCRREPIVGTRLSRRICTTSREDQVLTDETRAQIHRMQSELPAIPSN